MLWLFRGLRGKYGVICGVHWKVAMCNLWNSSSVVSLKSQNFNISAEKENDDKIWESHEEVCLQEFQGAFVITGSEME